VAQLLEAPRHGCEVAGSIPDGVNEILSGFTMSLESNQPLTKMSTRNIS
jgi:hypothetical protein